MRNFAASILLSLVSFSIGCGDTGGESAVDGGSGGDASDGGFPGYSSELQALTLPSANSNSKMGSSLSMDGEWMVVGVPGAALSGQRPNGSVEVYRHDQEGWRAFATLRADDAVADDQREFGASVGIFGSTIVVGDPSWASSNIRKAGAAYVFEWNGSAWLQQARLNADTVGGFDVFGTSVAVSENSILVGASGRELGEDSAAGAVFAFERTGASWNLASTIQRQDQEQSRFFGQSVDMDGIRGVIGSSGAVHTLSSAQGPWARGPDIVPNAESDGFGGNVAVDGDVAVVGAAQDDISASTSGAAYVFRFVSGEWVEEAKLKSPSPSKLGFFGISIAVAGDWILVGEPNHDSGSQDDVNDTSMEDSGAAFLYKYNGSGWELDRYIKSPNITPSARFGSAVSLSATLLSVGAPGISSGDEVNVGAVYASQ